MAPPYLAMYLLKIKQPYLEQEWIQSSIEFNHVRRDVIVIVQFDVLAVLPSTHMLEKRKWTSVKDPHDLIPKAGSLGYI